MQQFGRYQLIRKLATGGMAEVFLAKAVGPFGFEKTLVLKRILRHLAEEPPFVEMFLGEARLAAQLNHPNIVQIFDFGEADGEYFIAMEYIDGPNLRLLLKQAATLGVVLPPAMCAWIIRSACEGLAFAHDLRDANTCAPLGLIHRDISPDNILVSRQGAVKVVDFGIAKAAGQSHKTQSGIIKGKLAYMPPEQIRARELDRRVDVYALCIVFYELITGRKPFEAPTDASLMHAILTEPLVPAARYRPDLPEQVQRILDGALTKDREQRYPDCLTLALDLDEFIHSTGERVTTQQLAQLVSQITPGTDRPVPTPQPGTPGSRPRPSVTPVHTPDMFHDGTGTGPREYQDPVDVPPNGDAVALVETEPEPSPAKTVPLPVLEMMVKEQDLPARSRQPNRWLATLSSAVLLAVGGCLLFWRTSLGPEPTQHAIDAQPLAPVVTAATPVAMPLPTGAAAVAKPPDQSSQHPPPLPEQPAAALKVEPTTSGDKPTAVKSPSAPKGSHKRALLPQENPESIPTPPPSPAVVSTGTVVFQIHPYATVIINGEDKGQTPFPPVSLPAGTHHVRYVNRELGVEETETLAIKGGESLKVRRKLGK